MTVIEKWAGKRWVAHTIALVITGASLAVATPALAGTYTVYSCKLPDGTPASTSAWARVSGSANNAGASYCSGGGSMIAFMRGNAVHPVGDHNEFVFTAPADTTIRGYAIWRSARLWRNSSFNYSYALLEGDRSLVTERCDGGQLCGTLGTADTPLDPSNLVKSSGPRSIGSIFLSLACRGSANCGALTNGDSPAQLRLHRSDVVIEDNIDPVIASVNGPGLGDSAPVADALPLSITAADRGGGVHEAIAVIDGKEVARATLDGNGGRCQPPFMSAVPCKLTASGTLAVNSSSLADGQHLLELRVTDATGTNVGVWGPAQITTANGACTPGPRVKSLRMRAFFRRRSGRKVAVSRTRHLRFGRGATVHGQLVTPSGEPVGGAELCVAARNDMTAARIQPTSRIRTDARGRFTYKVRRGPSRSVYFIHRVPEGAVVASVFIRVPAAVRMRPSRRRLLNGHTVVLRGGLVGRPVPTRRLLVELQVRRSNRWQTFGTTHTRRRGRFRLAYRFTRTEGVERYRFRALVRRQSPYPYAAGASRPITVTVRG